LAALVLLPSAAFAQATLQGVVTDTSGAVLPGVTVEAASPALIEGVRSTITGGEGRYTITALRPGTYTVSFILPGFATVVQEGVTISTAGAATVDAIMQVGGLEETVTVTGEAPIVDVTTATRAATLSADTVDALPTSRNYLGLARLIPGTSGGDTTDVGGSRTQGVGGQMSIHGSRPNDQRVMLNGVMTQTLQAGGGLGGQVPDMGTAAEVVVEHTAVSAELAQGGVRINFVPRDGGNTFSTSDFFTFSNSAMQGDNFTSDLQAAGLATPNQVDFNYDLNVAAGGPLAQDKVWFWFSARRNRASFFTPVFWNQNAFNPNEFLYVADTSRPGNEQDYLTQTSVRLTWQASPRMKIAGTYKRDRWCQCAESGGATESPEATEDFRFPRLEQQHLEWTSPVNNNLLLEVVALHLFERWGNMHPHQNGLFRGFDGNAAAIANANQLVSIQDQGLNLTYGLNNDFNNTLVPNYTWRATATYVTGTHNVKFGVNGMNGFLDQNNYKINNMSYRFRNGVPNQITLYANPIRDKSTENYDIGVYLQDTISLDRLTIGLAARYDALKTGYPAGTLGQAEYAPERQLSWDAGEILNFTDLTWRSSVTYDLFGNGRTALKVTANKYLEGQTLNGIGRAGHPAARIASSTNRAWRDSDHDFFPDCDLLNRAANGECGAWSNNNFGSLNAEENFSANLLGGFGNREANWEYSGGIQQERARGVSIDLGYFKRDWQNLQVVDNRALDADDFTTFELVVPTDARLPNGGGYTITGFRAITPASFGVGADNITLRAKELGTFTEGWQGFDVNLNARLQNGLQLSFGTSTGRNAENDCDLVNQLIDQNLNRSLSFCDRSEPYTTQAKGYAVYTIPTADVQVSATFRSTPGPFINANFVATNAYLAANSTLGRALAGGAANMTVQIIEPNGAQLERLNQLDLRFGKVLRMGPARSVVSLDVFNALNTNTPLSVNQTFGTSYLAPQSILDARLLKVSVQFDW
ncbi:MAG: carboxypeptidase-like regulatory domain-containing protein, partial [Rhodospirillaceae bacterium]